MKQVHGTPYGVRLEECRQAVHAFLTDLFEKHGRVRSVEWDASRDPEDVNRWITRLAMALVAMRSEPPKEGLGGYCATKPEQPYRAQAVLFNLARGHALVHGRRQLTVDDLPLAAHVAVSSMPLPGAQVFRGLVQEGRPLSVAQVQALIGARHPDTARKVMENLDGRRVMAFEERGIGKAAELCFREPDWAWCGSPEFRDILLAA